MQINKTVPFIFEFCFEVDSNFYDPNERLDMIISGLLMVRQQI